MEEEKKYKPIKIENISKQGLKSSQEKSFRKQLIESIPKLEQIIDQIWTKKNRNSIRKIRKFQSIFFK